MPREDFSRDEDTTDVHRAVRAVIAPYLSQMDSRFHALDSNVKKVLTALTGDIEKPEVPGLIHRVANVENAVGSVENAVDGLKDRDKWLSRTIVGAGLVGSVPLIILLIRSLGKG